MRHAKLYLKMMKVSITSIDAIEPFIKTCIFYLPTVIINVRDVYIACYRMMVSRMPTDACRKQYASELPEELSLN